MLFIVFRIEKYKKDELKWDLSIVKVDVLLNQGYMDCYFSRVDW